MRKKWLTSVLLGIVVIFSGFSQSGISKKLDALPSHPRLLMQQGEEKALMEKINKSATWRQIHESIISAGEDLLTRPPLERKKIGMRLLDVSRESLRRIFFLSYSYRMTGEEKYLQRAEKELIAVCRFTDWNPSHFLDVAEMTLGVSIGYDWLYKELPEDSKKIIRAAIRDKGLRPSFDESYNWFLKTENNWNQVCNAGMTFGALATYEEDKEWNKNIILRALRSLPLAMKEYEPDGAYPEGYSYWEYGTTYNVLLLAALNKILGEDITGSLSRNFMQTASYYEHMTGPTGQSFNYSDCEFSPNLSPAMYWFAQKGNAPSLLWVEKNYLSETNRANNTANRFLPLVLLWGGDINIEKLTPPQSLMWTGGGRTPVSMMRTSWTSPEAIYVAIKGGSPSSNHAHMDIGSFVMDAGGVRWAMDLGKQDYESLESRNINLWSMAQESSRWQVYRYNNYSHNTLTINNELQQVSGYAPIEHTTHDTTFMSAVCDLSSVYATTVSSCRRGIALVDKKYVMVRDEISAPADTPSTIRWTMLTPAKVKKIKKDRIELEQSGKKLTLKVVGKYPVRLQTWDTRSPNAYDASNAGTVKVGFESEVPAGATGHFTVYLLPEGSTYDSGKNMPLSQWPENITDN